MVRTYNCQHASNWLHVLSAHLLTASPVRRATNRCRLILAICLTLSYLSHSNGVVYYLQRKNLLLATVIRRNRSLDHNSPLCRRDTYGRVFVYICVCVVQARKKKKQTEKEKPSSDFIFVIGKDDGELSERLCGRMSSFILACFHFTFFAFFMGQTSRDWWWTHQNTYVGFSVARFSRHSRRNVEPSSMCKSGAPLISATASGNDKMEWNQRGIKSCLSCGKVFKIVWKDTLHTHTWGTHSFREIGENVKAYILP
jgi:hypothetical protein